MDWQRVRVLSTAEYFHDLILGGAGDGRTYAIYEGLLDVLDPDRRSARDVHRKGREAGNGGGDHPERRAGTERRILSSRRVRNIGRAAGERRTGRQRRSIYDRRSD